MIPSRYRGEYRRQKELDKIRAEIAALEENYRAYADYTRASVIGRVLQIIDKYRAEED